MSSRVLLIDDEELTLELLAAALRTSGYLVETATGATDALAHLEAQDFDAVISDICLTGRSGIEICTIVSATYPEIPVLLITAHSDTRSAVAALHAGASDFITKPILLDTFLCAVRQAVDRRQLEREVHRLRWAAASSSRIDGLIGESPAVLATRKLVERVAPTSASVLILGETGTGKELVARALHAQSPRRSAPFVAINCAAMTPTLLENELFGHSRGAYTDAKEAHPGLLMQAHGGTLFLDEIGEMPIEMQPKLLRALQERKVRPVGGGQEVPFDSRLIASTNRDLELAVEKNRFRADLFYRINVVLIPVAPLRERGNDVLLLAQSFLRRQAERSGKPVVTISTAAARKLSEYEWPGNVRELENCMERAVALAQFSEIGLNDLPDKVRLHHGTHMLLDASEPEGMLPLKEMERRYVRRALAAVGGNKTQAARILGIDRTSLYRRLHRLDLEKDEHDRN